MSNWGLSSVVETSLLVFTPMVHTPLSGSIIKSAQEPLPHRILQPSGAMPRVGLGYTGVILSRAGLATVPIADGRRCDKRAWSVRLQKGYTLLTNRGVRRRHPSSIVGLTAQVNSSDALDVSRERETVVAKNIMIACGVAVALVVPGASALAAGGQGGAHRATPLAAAH